MAETMVDRRATGRELAAIRRLWKGTEGCLIEKLAATLGVSTGYLSEALRGQTKTALRLSHLRLLRQAIEQIAREGAK